MAVECGTCGKKIRLIQTPDGKTVVCDYKPVRFDPAGGPHTFIAKDGVKVYGRRNNNGTESGFFRHSHLKAANG